MYDYGLSTLEKYGLTADGTCRIRGALLCQTDQGPLILKEFYGSEKKLKKQQELLQVLEEKGFQVDGYLENQEGNLVTSDKDGITYTLQHYQEGRECDTRNREDLKKSIQYLARLHQTMRMPFQEEYQTRSLKEEYVRHNQELRKIRKFIMKKGASCTFEKAYLSSIDLFLKKGEEALTRLQDSGYEKLRETAAKEGTICHGEYHQHNVCFGKQGMFAVNFSHWNYDIQAADLYRFLRKILEKYNWECTLGEELLKVYHEILPFTKELWEYLEIRFLYPEKYWKLADHYYSHKKVWIPEKNVEKLQLVIRQQENWERFTRQCFSNPPF